MCIGHFLAVSCETGSGNLEEGGGIVTGLIISYTKATSLSDSISKGMNLRIVREVDLTSGLTTIYQDHIPTRNSDARHPWKTLGEGIPKGSASQSFSHYGIKVHYTSLGYSGII